VSTRAIRLARPAPGRILLRPSARTVAPRQAVGVGVGPWTAWRGAVLVLGLVMFAQCFQYMVDVPPLYALSKAWPVLMVPCAVWALIMLDIPYKPLHVITLFWLVGVTPVIGIYQLGNGFPAALATTVKVWAFSYTFSAAGLLVYLRPPVATLRRVLVGLGAATYVIMVLLWIVVPAGAYGGGDAVSKLFIYDPERGRHIYMPMFFGALLLLYLNRSFWVRPRWWKPVVIGIAFLLMLSIYKERVTIAALMGTLVLGAAMSAGRARWALLGVLGLLGFAGALLLVQHLQSASNLNSLGGSLSVRNVSVATAWQFLSEQPQRWLFGVGATTRFGNVTFAQLFGNAMFFLTDIGWLGVMFEYGAIGLLLILLVHVVGLRITLRWARGGDPMTYAFADYIVFLLVESVVYSVVFTPGELTTILALAYYFHRQTSTVYGGGVLQPFRSRPRHMAMDNARPSSAAGFLTPSGTASSG
jgi:hypothetical protein